MWTNARWLTLGQKILGMFSRKNGLCGKSFKVLDIKVKYNIADSPYPILTRVRILNPHQTNVSGGTKDVGGGTN